MKTGKRGRPKKFIDLDFLCEACSAHRQLSITSLAMTLNVHRNVLWRFMKEHGIQNRYSNISNNRLDDLIRAFKQQKPESGVRYAIGYLRSHSMCIQRHRVLASMQRVDRLGHRLRERKAIQRRKYEVKRPNALWHLDGHHKMIRWGIVIHGIVDGYCRTVCGGSCKSETILISLQYSQITGLRASNNNRSTTVLGLFLDSIDDHGMPSRLRGDRGGENISCAVYMVAQNGPNRGSFLWGT
jgi:hypothetical protein